MANEFYVRKGLIVSGSTLLSGSLNVTQGITGSLLGTSSYANNADLLDGLNSTVFATTGSNTFVGNQIVSGTMNVSSSLTVNGTTMFVDAPNNRVGIGTTTPDASLAIIKDSPLSFQESDAAISIRAAVGDSKLILGGVTGSHTFIQSLQNGTSWVTRPLVLQQRGGNVGIGTTSPNATLTVNGNTNVTGSFTVVTGSAVEFQVTNLGVNIGNTTTDIHNVTGSLRVSGSAAINGNSNITGSLDVTGAFTAQTKSFKIKHQTQIGKSLVYGVLEGAEHAVYARGKLNGKDTIELPDEWTWLVDEDSITVQLTPINNHQKLYVQSIHNNKITVGNANMLNSKIHCYYIVHATRKDVDPLVTVV